MQKIFIQNEYLKVGINQKGAELAHLQFQPTGKEYLWQADPQFWGRHSCVLFPYIGKVFEDQYRIGDQIFRGGQHGFARNMKFEYLNDKEADVATFRLQFNEETLKLYPYKFALVMRYTLEKNQLHITYEVENLDDQTIYFSLGAHPGFIVPLFENEKRADYHLEFEQEETAKSLGVVNGYLGNTEREIFNGKNIIHIKDDLFDQDALIFKNLNSEYLHLVNGQGKKIWTFYFKDFPYLGIWSQNREAPFVCIEPWCGVADKNQADWDFREKDGIETLELGKKFTRVHSVMVYG